MASAKTADVIDFLTAYFRWLNCYDDCMNAWYDFMMRTTKRTTANLSEDLLLDARSVTKKGITETLIYGLELVKRTGAYGKAQRLRGKLSLDIDLKKSRERGGA